MKWVESWTPSMVFNAQRHGNICAAGSPRWSSIDHLTADAILSHWDETSKIQGVIGAQTKRSVSENVGSTHFLWLTDSCSTVKRHDEKQSYAFKK